MNLNDKKKSELVLMVKTLTQDFNELKEKNLTLESKIDKIEKTYTSKCCELSLVTKMKDELLNDNKKMVTEKELNKHSKKITLDFNSITEELKSISNDIPSKDVIKQNSMMIKIIHKLIFDHEEHYREL